MENVNNTPKNTGIGISMSMLIYFRSLIEKHLESVSDKSDEKEIEKALDKVNIIFWYLNNAQFNNGAVMPKWDELCLVPIGTRKYMKKQKMPKEKRIIYQACLYDSCNESCGYQFFWSKREVNKYSTGIKKDGLNVSINVIDLREYDYDVVQILNHFGSHNDNG